MATSSPPTQILSKLWELLRAHDPLHEFIREANFFEQSLHRDWRLGPEPRLNEVPDIAVEIPIGGEVGNLDTNLFWFPSTQYNIVSRTRDLNPAKMLDLWWQICAAVVGVPNPKLGLAFVHQAELLAPQFEYLPAESEPTRRVIIQPLMVHWESLPPTS